LLNFLALIFTATNPEDRHTFAAASVRGDRQTRREDRDEMPFSWFRHLLEVFSPEAFYRHPAPAPGFVYSSSGEAVFVKFTRLPPFTVARNTSPFKVG
jgi:hypothetical protein